MAIKIPVPNNKKPSNLIRLGIFWAIVGLIILGSVALFFPRNNLAEISISEAIKDANAGNISLFEIQGDTVTITQKNEEKPSKIAIKQSGVSIQEQGLADNAPVDIKIIPESNTSGVIWSVATIVLPVILIGAIFAIFMKQAQGQNNQAMGFGRSKAKLYGADKEKVVFADVAGNEAAKKDLEEVVDFLKHPKKYEALGAKIPRGVLLVGHPGTGKTMLARAVAGEANVPFFSISGSEFVEMFVGVGASRVRDLFAKAKKNSPSIIFIDEIDAVGRRRGSGMGGGHDEREQTLNQILVEMDGFEKGSNVIVLAATNRADVLDPALLRPGRFDRHTNIILPERRDRLAILKIHFKNKPVDSTVNLDHLAAKTVGSSGADLANIANEAAIVAAGRNAKKISNADITEAFEKIAIGPERKAKVMSDQEKEMTAYHEAGHALVGHVLPDSDQVHKVTIIPRGGTGGVTWFLPPEDKSYTSIIEFKDILARALGGRMAEQAIYGPDRVTTGAGSDLQHVSSIARDMIMEQGMGTKLRNQVFHEDEGSMMFEKITHERHYSDETAKEIDKEVTDLIQEATKRAEVVIQKNRPALDKLMKALLEEETLEEERVAELLKDAVLPKEAKLY